MRSKRIGLGLLLLCLSFPSCILGQDVGPSASENPVRSLFSWDTLYYRVRGKFCYDA